MLPDLAGMESVTSWSPVGFFFFFFFFDLGFTALSRIFHLYRADRSSKVGENRSTRRKTTWPSVSRTWLSHIWPELGSNHSGEKPNGLSQLSYPLGYGGPHQSDANLTKPMRPAYIFKHSLTAFPFKLYLLSELSSISSKDWKIPADVLQLSAYELNYYSNQMQQYKYKMGWTVLIR